MSENASRVAGITLFTDKPTPLTFQDLFNWVIWQFPRPKASGLCGAVRPPLADHGWYPALIIVDDEKVQVYGHVKTEFSSPEAAADYFSDKKNE